MIQNQTGANGMSKLMVYNDDRGWKFSDDRKV